MACVFISGRNDLRCILPLQLCYTVVWPEACVALFVFPPAHLPSRFLTRSLAVSLLPSVALLAASQAFGMGTIVPIAALTNKSRRVRIQARVVKIWQAVHAGTRHTFGMGFLLLDDKNGAIQGFVSVRDYQKTSQVFIEGHICEFARFTVEHAKLRYNVVKNSYSVLFTKETTVLPLPENFINVPLLFFSMKRLEDIGGAISGDKTIVDVVARISGFGPIQNIQQGGKMSRVRSMYLTNERNFTLDVSLWGNFIDLFDPATLAEESKASPAGVACSSMQLRMF